MFFLNIIYIIMDKMIFHIVKNNLDDEVVIINDFEL